MVSVQEVFQLAIEMDMMHLAHRIFWAIAEWESESGGRFRTTQCHRL